MDETVQIAPGVTRYDCEFFSSTRGTKADLIAAGVAAPEWFLDGKVRNKAGRAKRQVNITQEGREGYCRQPHPGEDAICTVCISYTPQERASRQRAARERVEMVAQRELSRYATSAEWLESIEDAMGSFVRTMLSNARYLSTETGGWRALLC